MASRYNAIDHLPLRAHSVLTLCYRKWERGKPEPATHLAYRQLLAFLDCKLKKGERYEDPPTERITADPGENIDGNCSLKAKVDNDRKHCDCPK
jgi:hypothetical protein